MKTILFLNLPTILICAVQAAYLGNWAALCGWIVAILYLGLCARYHHVLEKANDLIAISKRRKHPMGLKTIQDEWDCFVSHAMSGVDANPVRVEDMKRSFYAGALVMHGMLQDACNPELTNDTGGRYLEERRNEAMLFFQDAIKKDTERN